MGPRRPAGERSAVNVISPLGTFASPILLTFKQNKTREREKHKQKKIRVERIVISRLGISESPLIWTLKIEYKRER